MDEDSEEKLGELIRDAIAAKEQELVMSPADVSAMVERIMTALKDPQAAHLLPGGRARKPETGKGRTRR